MCVCMCVRAQKGDRLNVESIKQIALSSSSSSVEIKKYQIRMCCIHSYATFTLMNEHGSWKWILATANCTNTLFYVEAQAQEEMSIQSKNQPTNDRLNERTKERTNEYASQRNE